MKVKNLLQLGYGAVLVIAGSGLLLALISVLGLTRLNEESIHANAARLEAISQMRTLLAWRQMTRTGGHPARYGGQEQDLRERGEAFRHWLELAVQNTSDSAERNILEQIAARRPQLWPERSDELSPFDAATTQLLDKVSNDSHRLYELNLERLIETGSAAAQRSVSIAWLLGLIAVATLFIGLLVSQRLAHAISRPLEALSMAARQVAEGDFSVKLASYDIHEADIVARQFNEMTASVARFNALNIDTIIAEQRRNEAVLASIDDGLIICGSNGRIERINPIGERQLGRRAEECLGRRIGQLIGHPELDQQIRICLDERTDDSDPLLELVLGEGENRRVLSYSLVPFQDVDEVGVVMVLRDITVLREFEAMRTEFVLRASHELRTPLTSIRMAMGLLGEKLMLPEASREKELMDTMAEEMQRMMRLLGDLLDLSRLYARSLQMETQTINVIELLSSTTQRFEHSAAEAGIEILQDCENEELEVAGDRIHLDRVLDNLVSNALRHTPSGGTVRLGCRRRGSSVEISVSDTGEGIPYHQQSRVFEPFVQVGRNVGASGLGLAMCREIVQQLGGRISLRSVPGKGSIFSLQLPV